VFFISCTILQQIYGNVKKNQQKRAGSTSKFFGSFLGFVFFYELDKEFWKSSHFKLCIPIQILLHIRDFGSFILIISTQNEKKSSSLPGG